MSLSIAHAPDKLDTLIQAEMKRQRIPGLSYLIARNGKVVRTGAFGRADLELDVPAQPNDLYEIGSMTKQFTASALLLLIEQGKIHLEQPVSEFIPELPAAWSGVTIRDLAYQTSGVPDYVFTPTLGLTDDFDRKGWFEGMKDQPLDFPAGTAWAYSNSNYALLGWVIEKASGVPYTQFVTDGIFRPLQMTHTRFMTADPIVARRSHGYMKDGDTLTRAPGGGYSIASDGTIASTAGDLAKWDAALRARRLFKPASYALMWAPAVLKSGRGRPYGMGWFLASSGAPGYVGHGGNCAGYSAGIARFETGGLTVIVLGNVYAFSGEGLAKRIAETIDPSLRVKVPAVTADPKPERTARIRLAVGALAANKADTELLEPEITGPMGSARAGMSRPFAPFVNIEGFDYAGEHAGLGVDEVSYRVKASGRMYTMVAMYTPAGKLAQIILRPDA